MTEHDKDCPYIPRDNATSCSGCDHVWAHTADCKYVCAHLPGCTEPSDKPEPDECKRCDNTGCTECDPEWEHHQRPEHEHIGVDMAKPGTDSTVEYKPGTPAADVDAIRERHEYRISEPRFEPGVDTSKKELREANTDVATLLQALTDAQSELDDDLIRLTTPWDEHPEWWDNACNCALCRSYADG